MKIKLLSLFFLVTAGISGYSQQTTTRIFNEVLFYDGYAATVTEPVAAGVIRHRNDLYATKISAAQLAAFGTEITLEVKIKAACDNYDRIGNVNLALVPKGQTTYELNGAGVKRIEIARYITPFMNKNKTPNTVPYNYDLSNISRIFKDNETNANYDIWMELEVFGVPYAAQTQVAGCSGRIDVFYGTVDIISNQPSDAAEVVDDLYLKQLFLKHDLNNYQEGASDVVGQSKKTISFNVENTIYNAKLYLITSNHGAGEGGEEYVRREHYAYFDESLKLQYKPGGISCEPFRIYNTQANGIYGPTPKSEASWTSWNNWCPGNIIPIRIIDLGTVAAGTHTFALDVPQAEFVGNDGKIPISLYLQAHTKPYTASIDDLYQPDLSIYPNPTHNHINVVSDQTISTVVIVDLSGKKITETKAGIIDLTSFSSGIYFLNIQWENGAVTTRKVMKY
ncbi:peptide-N-glycosidase F-related protein [Flavobacterium sp. NKUCC04_CG]|uniref:peptide-N-glycosidase F-related protein n=1 Tax=Flavobacterium sp. NKUCC04_CG TaxID=2842121 RepID=UPI001C5AC3C9|nr:peptide-N-glycosidase F-related protein [Flavobacterium sp. NKUCC04_CG]MBW3518570.1 T9SS type A sorting domain-containing protein [Flavobacterium sp. NKUCC04_CG]